MDIKNFQTVHPDNTTETFWQIGEGKEHHLVIDGSYGVDEIDRLMTAFGRLKRFLRVTPAAYDLEYGWYPVYPWDMYEAGVEYPYDLEDLPPFRMYTVFNNKEDHFIIEWLPNETRLPLPTFEQFRKAYKED